MRFIEDLRLSVWRVRLERPSGATTSDAKHDRKKARFNVMSAVLSADPPDRQLFDLTWISEILVTISRGT